MTATEPAADDCATTVRLRREHATAQLTVADASGTESGLRLSLNVRDLIVVAGRSSPPAPGNGGRRLRRL
jgi:hypothetical protein